MRFGSLFSGIGGLDLGLERAGMECAWQVEIDAYCQWVLAKHWPEVARHGDIRECGAHNLSPVDLICGGFPCQPVSLAGKRKAQADERWLWPEFARIIRELRPQYALVENVPGLLSAGMGDVLGDLAALGYDAEWQSIPAAAVGAPHLRYRVFIVAYAYGSERGRNPKGGMSLTGMTPDGKKRQVDLGWLARLFPTPNSSGFYRTNSDKANPTLTLEGMARKGLWPTPQAGANNPAAHNAMSGDFKRAFCERAGIPITGQLNPTWVEWLMGFPLGWTDLEDSAMP